MKVRSKLAVGALALATVGGVAGGSVESGRVYRQR
jgi:hypothetical protein